MVDKLKRHKAAGVDEISADILKVGGPSLVVWLHEIIKGVWDTCQAPKEWKQALIVPVFKSGSAALLDDYRGISLLSIPGKVFRMIIGGRLKSWADEQLLDAQCGFRPTRGCADAIFSLKRVHEEALRRQCNMCTLYIDLSKAYDCINRSLAWEIFEHRGMPPKLIALLKDLHSDTYCALKGNHKASDSWFQFRTGLRQGDVNAPMLFNLFIDTVVRCLEPLLRQSGVRFVYMLDGQLRVSSVRDMSQVAWILMFADDIALVIEDNEASAEIMQLVDHTFAQWGLEVSLKKTKAMPLLAGEGSSHEVTSLSIDRGEVEYVSQSKSLGSITTSGLAPEPEIANRLAKAGSAFHGFDRLWADYYVSKEVNCSIYKTIVQTTML